MAEDPGRRVGRVSLKVMPDLRTLREDIRVGVNDAVRGMQINMPVVADLTRAAADLARFKEQVAARAVDLGVDADTAKASAELDHAARDRTSRISVDVDREGVSSVAMLGTRLAALAPLSIAAAGGIASVASSAAQLAGIAAVGPAAIAGLGAVIGTFVVATDGMGKAIKGNATALAGLSPAARGAAEALAGFGSSFAPVKRQIQQDFWGGFTTGFAHLQNVLIPQLRDGMGNLATALGGTMNTVVDSLRTSLSNGVLTNILNNIADGARLGSAAIRPLVDAATTLVNVGSGQAAAAGQWITDLATKFDRFVQNAANSGGLQRWIDNAKTGFHDLGQVITNAGTILLDITGAAAAGGGGLAALADLLGKVRDVVSSPAFQSSLTGIFTAARDGARAIGDALPALGTALQGLAQPLEDLLRSAGGLAAAVITGFGHLATGLGPILSVVTGGLSTVVRLLGDLPAPASTALAALAAFQVVSRTKTFRNVAAAVGDMHTKITTASEAVPTQLGRIAAGAKTFAGSALAAFGGPWGIAITAATTGFSLLAQAIVNSNQPLIDSTTLVDNNTGALSANAQATVAKALADQGYLDLASKAGIASGELTKAYLGNSDAIADVTKKVNDYITSGQTAFVQGPKGIIAAGDAAKNASIPVGKYWDLLHGMGVQSADIARQMRVNAQATAETAAATAKAAASASTYRDAQDESKTAAVRAKTAYDAYALSTTKMGQAQDDARTQAVQLKTEWADVVKGLSPLTTALYDATGKALGLTDAASALVGVMDQASGITPDVTDAVRNFKQSLADAAQKALDSKGHIKELSTGVVDFAGHIDLNTQAGRDLSVTMEEVQRNAATVAAALGEQAAKSGDATKATQIVAASLQSSKRDFLENAKQMGLTAAQAHGLAKEYFTIPSTITTDIKVNAKKAQDAIKKLADTKIIIPVDFTTGASGNIGPRRFATGGFLDEGLNIVNDAGPELLEKHGNAVRVITAAQSQPILQNAVNNAAPATRGPLTINNYYPQAEPTSVTLMKARALDAALSTVG